MTENMRKWLELVSQDRNLQKKLEENPSQSNETIIEMASMHGIILTEQDFDMTARLSDEELDAVSGGVDPLTGEYYTCGCITTGFGDNAMS